MAPPLKPGMPRTSRPKLPSPASPPSDAWSIFEIPSVASSTVLGFSVHVVPNVHEFPGHIEQGGRVVAVIVADM